MRPLDRLPMFMRNAWYVAAWDHEVTGERPFGRVLLGEPVVLYRMKSGEVVALEDRCCHRHYPLHKATHADDRLECAYHGFTYDCTGKCVRIPGQATIPDTARVKRYPAVERHRWIWVWMGDPALADPAEIVDFHWLDGSTARRRERRRRADSVDPHAAGAYCRGTACGETARSVAGV